MVKEHVYIRIIRFEGVPFLTKCEVYQNQEQIESLLPIISEKRVKLSQGSNYQIKAECSALNFSVSFSYSLFTEDGMFWLPLFSTPDDSLIFHQEEVSEPRVLVIVHRKTAEDNLLTEETVDYEIMPEIKLDYEENTVIIHEDQESYAESSLNRPSNVDTTDDKISRDVNQEKIVETSIYYQESLNSQKNFSEKLLKEIDLKNNELGLALDEISELKVKIKKLEVENNYLKTLTNGFVGVQIKDLVNQLSVYKEKIQGMDVRRSEIEDILKAECSKLKIGPFFKDEEEVYNIGGKKFNLLMKNGQVFCRTGNTYKEFRKVVMENTENRQAVFTTSKSPFRKNLSEVNTTTETPRSSSKLSENFSKGKKVSNIKRNKA